MRRYVKSKTPNPESANLKTSGNKRFLNKTPYPTTFSNKKSQNYLNEEEDPNEVFGIENYTSNRSNRVPGLALSSIA